MYDARMHDGRTAEDVLSELNRRWMQAYVSRDVAFLRDHMAEGYVGTFPDGSVHSKQGEIEALVSGRIAIEEMAPEEMRVQLCGDAAVLTGRSRIRASVGGSRVEGALRFTDVWVHTANGWRAIASHATRLAA